MVPYDQTTHNRTHPHAPTAFTAQHHYDDRRTSCFPLDGAATPSLTATTGFNVVDHRVPRKNDRFAAPPSRRGWPRSDERRGRVWWVCVHVYGNPLFLCIPISSHFPTGWSSSGAKHCALQRQRSSGDHSATTVRSRVLRRDQRKDYQRPRCLPLIWLLKRAELEYRGVGRWLGKPGWGYISEAT